MKNLAIAGGAPLRTEPFKGRRTMGEEEKRAVIEVMDSDQLSSFFGSPGAQWLGGPKVKEFERKWAEQYGFKHAISVNSWTTGLMTAVGAVGVEPGDEVIVSPYTMSASATAILFYGAIPVFADVDPLTFNLTAASIEARITPRTKAIMLVHLFGQACDMDPIMALARRHNLKVIEDAAQAPGVYYKGQPVGAIGDVGGFSLNYHKHIHTGEGGMLVTNDDHLALRCQMIRNHAENLTEAQGMEDLSNMIGSNYRLTELQAAIGCVQLDRLDGYLAHRQRLARHLGERLAGIAGLTAATLAEGAGHAYYVYPIKYDAAVTGIERSLFVRAVNAELPVPGSAEQVGLVAAYVRPLYLAPLYQKKIALGSKGFPWSMHPELEYDYAKGLCPVVERLHEQEMLLTTLVREPLGEADIDAFVDAIRKVLAHSDELAGLA
ncbi:DegT/DnrJ/EryC1/StrS family aminotransferase [Janthinobacterium sp.]|uniref:DegT/DnrJ/EryC1/StrS family aminotransferase n=1 Tax=Janthinobacterium sp. TaxID=1871054 RepID=UPI00293D7962|nr:DegT/DnrJ/EryC1/StrS family aminotransferase [Janthinobacterium sp.]